MRPTLIISLISALITVSVISRPAPATPGASKCSCPKSCPTDPDADEVPMVVPAAAKSAWTLLSRYRWQRRRARESLTLSIDRKERWLSLSAPSLDEVGHGAVVEICAVRKIKRGLALRLSQQVHGFGGLYPLLRDKALRGPRSGRAISCCDELRVRIDRRGTRIKILGRAYRRAVANR